MTTTSSRNADIEGLADQVWQLREDGVEIHITVIRRIEAEISWLQYEEALDQYARCSAALWGRSEVPAESCEAAAEFSTLIRDRAAAAMASSTTAVPDLMSGRERDCLTARDLAASAARVAKAWANHLVFAAAAAWATSSSGFAASFTNSLNRMPKMLQPVGLTLGKLAGRTLGKGEYAPWTRRQLSGGKGLGAFLGKR